MIQTTKSLLVVPKDSGLSESDKKVLLQCGYLAVEVNDPKTFVQAVPMAPIVLSPDLITKALFETVISVQGAREQFGRLLTQYLQGGPPVNAGSEQRKAAK